MEKDNLKTKSKLMIGLFSFLGVLMVGTLVATNFTQKGTYSVLQGYCSFPGPATPEDCRDEGYSWITYTPTPTATKTATPTATKTPNRTNTPTPTTSCTYLSEGHCRTATGKTCVYVNGCYVPQTSTPTPTTSCTYLSEGHCKTATGKTCVYVNGCYVPQTSTPTPTAVSNVNCCVNGRYMSNIGEAYCISLGGTKVTSESECKAPTTKAPTAVSNVNCCVNGRYMSNIGEAYCISLGGTKVTSESECKATPTVETKTCYCGWCNTSTNKWEVTNNGLKDETSCNMGCRGGTPGWGSVPTTKQCGTSEDPTPVAACYCGYCNTSTNKWEVTGGDLKDQYTCNMGCRGGTPGWGAQPTSKNCGSLECTYYDEGTCTQHENVSECYYKDGCYYPKTSGQPGGVTGSPTTKTPTGGTSGGGTSGGGTVSNKPVKIYYNANGGSLKGTSQTNYFTNNSGWAVYDSDANSKEYIIQTCDVGATCNLWDYNGDKWLFSRNGYIAKDGAEWSAKKANGSYTSLNQATDYTHSQLVNVANKEQTDYYEVWLYVNWIATDNNSAGNRTCYSCISGSKTQYVWANSSSNAISAASSLSGNVSCALTDELNCQSQTTVTNCYECNGSIKHVMANSEADARAMSGGDTCTIVTTNKCNASDNPKTGTFGIIVAWIIGIATIGYSVWYFKKSTSIK